MARIFLACLFTISLITLAILFFWSRSLSRDYPKLLNSDTLNDTIAQIVSDGGRAVAMVTFQSGKKVTLPWAKILREGKELNLPRVVKDGDILIKKEFSDTIILLQDNDRHIFVAQKTIHENY